MSERLDSKLLGLLGAPEPWESEASGKLRHGCNFKGTVTPSPFSPVLCPLNTGTMWSWRAQSTTATSLTIIYPPHCHAARVHITPLTTSKGSPCLTWRNRNKLAFLLSICHSFNKYLWWSCGALCWILARADIWLGMTPDARVYSHYINIFKLLWELFYCFPNFLCSSPQLLLPCYNHSDLHKTPREGYTLLYRVAVIHILSLLQNLTKFFQLPKNQTVSSTELQQIAFLTLLVCPSCLSPSHTDHIPDSPHHNALWSLLRWQLS